MGDWQRKGFGGQCLDVFLVSESQLAGREEGWLAKGGGRPLTAVLGRALDDSFTYLRHLDEYGDTVFNGLQMDAVIPELHQLMPHARAPTERSALEQVIEMAGRARDGYHYLLFGGD